MSAHDPSGINTIELWLHTNGSATLIKECPESPCQANLDISNLPFGQERKITADVADNARNWGDAAIWIERVPTPRPTPPPSPQPAQPRMFARPEGRAPNLVVLVHGCCTNAVGVRNVWENNFGSKIAESIAQKDEWEIVVWDWTKCRHDPNVECTPRPPIWEGKNFLNMAGKAYEHAKNDEGRELADAIADAMDMAVEKEHPPYKYIHLISHSAGAKLIDEAAKQLAKMKPRKNAEKPFIHLTFLDAYTPPGEDEESKYGSLSKDYPHYSEHYVDRGKGALPSTNKTLKNAFNFDITRWKHTQGGGLLGHDWPLNWYINNITAPEFNNGVPGFPLSLEGGYNKNKFDKLSERFPPNDGCEIIDKVALLLCKPDPPFKIPRTPLTP